VKTQESFEKSENVFQNVQELSEFLSTSHTDDTKLVVTSGGFDPFHIGHLRCIQDAAKMGTLVVVVNGDGFLKRKKGRSFMELSERMEIIAGLSGVDYVVSWEDPETQTVSGAIEVLRPDVFAKGGDRSDPSKIPEWDVCQSVGCDVVFNVGGGKIQSSSDLTRSYISLLDDKNVVEKPWGRETIWAKSSKYAGKILEINPGSRLSLQYHEHKEETIFVLEGNLLLDTEFNGRREQIALETGRNYHISPGTIHRFSAGHNKVVLIEVSTPELSDVVRLEDDYNRG